MAAVLAAASYSRIGFSIYFAVRTRRVRVPGGSKFHLEPGTIVSYWIRHLNFCEGTGMTGIEVKESISRMDKIPSTMVLHKYVDGEDSIFAIMSGQLVNNSLGRFIGLIIRCAYQASTRDSS